MRKQSKKSKDDLLQEIEELKKERKALQETGRRYSMLLDNVDGAVYRCKNDPDYTMEFLSPAVKSFTGYSPEDLVDNKLRSWEDLIVREDRERVRRSIDEAVCKHNRFRLDYRITDASGNQKWLWEQGIGIYDEEGNLEALEGFISDVSQLIASQKAMEEGEQKFRDLYENAPVAYFSISHDGIIISCNKKAYQLLGYTGEVLRGKTFDSLFDEKSQKFNSIRKLLFSLEGNVRIRDHEVQLINAKGNPIWVSLTVNAMKDREGKIQEKRILALNIESRKKAENQLQTALSRLSLATRSAGIGIWEEDLLNGTLVWDDCMYMINGLVPGELEENPSAASRVIHPEDLDRVNKVHAGAIGKKKTFHVSYRVIHPDKSIRYIQSHGLVERDQAGKAIRITGINIDETNRIRTERHILRLNRLYTVLSNINQSIVRVRHLPAMFHEACSIAVNDGGFDLVWIALTNDSGNLELTASDGLNADMTRLARGIINSPDYLNGPAGEVLRTGQPVIIKNLAERKDYPGSPYIAGYKSMALFPLTAEKRMRGIFSLYSVSPGLFDDEEIRLLNELSSDISYAIEFSDKEEERNTVQVRLLETTNALSAVIDASPLAIIHLDPEGIVNLWNHTAEKIFGWKKEEVSGKFLPIVQKDKLEEFSKIRQQVLSGVSLTSSELKRKRKDGSSVFVSLSTAPVYDMKGNATGIIEVLEDITSRKIAEQKLLESESRYRFLFQNNPHPMLVYDSGSLKILEVNDSAVSKYGYDRDEFLKMTVLDIRPEDQQEKFLEFLSGERNTIRNAGTWKHRLKNGLVIDVNVTSHTLEYEGYDAVLVLAQDVTERTKWEEDLIRAKEEAEQSNRLKDAFVANISHEIRTPLNAILGFSGLIRDYLTSAIDEELSRYFDNITTSSHRLLRTVDMILNFSRLQVGAFNIHPHTLNIPDLIEQVVNENILSAYNKSLELYFENKAGNASIRIDEYCIMQAVANLISNAIKYTDKGSVMLTLYKDPHGFLNLDVKDTGIGMSENFFSQLFKPYSQEDLGYTRSYEGIGLGLSMVKQYLELNNASISFVSKQDEGTTFTIHFQQRPTDEKPGGDMMDYPSNTRQDRKIVTNHKLTALVVEDDPFSQDYMETILRERYHVVIAEGADEALKILSHDQVGVILMDISLKGETDGLKLTRRIKSDPGYQSIPVIILTAHAFAEDRKRSEDAGCNAYFSKPFNPGELLYKMEELLGASKGER